ncbi:histidine kinase [Spongisporangium articulatum]|uniref:Histidine kinase n=1 Tax=Spongisporangium articulatum TaxID=3362603 RepID=A0ABW8AJZ6_9ACTN
MGDVTPTHADVLRAAGALAVLAVLVAAAVPVWRARGHRDLGTPGERATFETLHTASRAAPPLRDGLTGPGARRAVKHLRTLLGTEAVALTDERGTLAWDGAGEHHSQAAGTLAATVLDGGRTQVIDVRRLPHEVLQAQGWACEVLDCAIRTAVVAPVTDGDVVVGTLIAYGPSASAGLVRATEEVARWVSAQVALAELDRSRTRAMEAELRALRAQISPHFVYNSLTAIASFVRTEPDRARELLLEFADFTRYALRRDGAFTTLADELSNVERYLTLEQARFGDQLVVRLQIAPEVLPVAVPFLAVQPLVENAVRHGLRRKLGVGHVTLGAQDAGAEALIWVDDDGAGADPELIRRLLAGESPEGDGGGSMGLSNVDARLRQVYGDDHGLVVETAPGAGLRVSFRVPKFAPQ